MRFWRVLKEHQTLHAKIFLYAAAVLMTIFVTYCVVDNIRLSMLSKEDQRMDFVLGYFESQFPHFRILSVFDGKNFIKNRYREIYDLRRKTLVSGTIFLPDGSEREFLTDKDLQYKKSFSHKENCWIFTFPSGAQIYLDANTLKIARIEEGNGGTESAR